MEPRAGVKLQGYTEATANWPMPRQSWEGALPTAAGLGTRSRGSGAWEES